MKNYFKEGRMWLKGNTHTHTTLSDGKYDPETVIGKYKAEGYNFLAITDHRKRFQGFSEDGFTVISGGEYHLNDFTERTAWHIIGLGTKEEIVNTDDDKPQQIVNRLRAAGGLVILAHPEWSMMTHAQTSCLEGVEAMEVYNSVSDYYSGRGGSAGYHDVLASKGLVLPMIASDDTHFYEREFAKGFIMVNAERNDEDSILAAIREKQFYASCGPRIHAIAFGDGTLHIRCSPVKKLIFYSDVFYDPHRVLYAEEGKLLTEGSYPVGKLDRVVRIEGIDENGRHFWSQFISADEIRNG